MNVDIQINHAMASNALSDSGGVVSSGDKVAVVSGLWGCGAVVLVLVLVLVRCLCVPFAFATITIVHRGKKNIGVVVHENWYWRHNYVCKNSLIEVADVSAKSLRLVTRHFL